MKHIFRKLCVNRRFIGKQMKTSTAHDFCATGSSILEFKSLSLNELNILETFFRNLTFDQRRARFGGGVSDHSVLHYCRCLDTNETAVFACISQDQPVAIVELHPIPSQAGCAELVVASSAADDRLLIYGHLLRLVAFAAGRRGYHTLVCALELLDNDVLTLLRGMARAEIRAGSLLFELGEYANLYAGQD